MVPHGTVCKDHYPESVIRESIIHSLKGAVADMARFMGPTTSIAHIHQKLTVIFGTVVSCDVLMQNFYKVTQSNHDKVPSFATRLEGTLNQIQLQCPGRITDQEVQQHLKTASSTGYANTLETQYDTSTAILGPLILSS